MTTDTMWRLGFEPCVQIVRLLVMVGLKFYVDNKVVETPASHLDQAWLSEFFTLMIAFLVSVNFIFILAFMADAPHIAFIVIRVLGGSCVALINHIEKGFTLYDALEAEDISIKQDSTALYFMRIIFLYICVGMTIYLLTSCCCLCFLSGIDGANVRNVRNPVKMFKRVPFGNLVF